MECNFLAELEPVHEHFDVCSAGQYGIAGVFKAHSVDYLFKNTLGYPELSHCYCRAKGRRATPLRQGSL